MCGVAISALTGDPVARVAWALERMPHRGPDGRDVSDFGLSALGSVRLAVRGNAAAAPRYAAQVAGDIVFNGEIYRTHGSGTPPATPAAEIEALLAARMDRAEADGMFALGMLDATSGDVVCARDRLGIKPLFYQHAGTGFDMVSEIAALPLGGQPREIDGDALIETLICGRPSPGRTHRKRVFELPPGGELRIARDGSHSLRVAPFSATAGRSPDDRAVAEVLRDSVAACCVTNGPVALAMSGGLDSVAIAFAMDALGIEDVQVFTVQVAGSEDGIEDLAELGLPEGGAWRSWTLHSIDVDAAAYGALMERALGAIDAPHRMSSAALVLALADAIHGEGIKVVLTGEGPDELDFGYSGHPRIAGALAAARDPSARADVLFDHLCPPGLARLLRGIVERDALDAGVERVRGALVPIACESDALALQELELRYSLAPLLHRSDHCFMARSVEARMPFLHGGYPDAARSAADRLPLAALLGKRRLREGLRGMLPKHLVDLPKRPFRAPIGRWMEQRFGAAMAGEVLRAAPLLARFGIVGVDAGRVAALSAEPDGAALLFTLANLARWIRLEEER
jgi:asparagine synthase (glutamine-hydrolysing)